MPNSDSTPACKFSHLQNPDANFITPAPPALLANPSKLMLLGILQPLSLLLCFFLLPQPHLPSSAGNFVGDLCPAWSCLPEGGCVLPCLFLPKQAFPCPKIAFTPNVCFHPRCSKSHHVPMGRRYELLQVRAAFLQPCVMAAEKFRLFPSEKYQRKIPGSQSFLSKCRGFPRESSTWF